MKNNNTNNRYFVHYNRTPYIIIGIVSAAFCLVFFLMLKDDISYDLTITHSYSRLLVLLGFCGIFLLINILFFALGIFTKEYMLMIDDKGITNNMAGAFWKFIPWEDIENIELFSTAGQVILGIIVIDENKYTEGLSGFRKRAAKSNKLFSDSLIQIGLSLAKEDVEEIAQELFNRWPESLKESAYQRVTQKIMQEEEEGQVELMGDASESSNAWKIALVMIAINVAIYVADLLVSNYMFGGVESLLDMLFLGTNYDIGIWFFGNISDYVMKGEIYRLLTHALFHVDIKHLLCNMYALFYVTLMHFNRYGKREYFTWYLAGALGGGLGTLALALVSGQTRIAVGASSAIFGLMGGAIAPMIFSALYAKKLGAKLRPVDRREMFNYGMYVLVMLVPGFFYKDVSWEGHLGGLIGGIIAGIVMLALKIESKSLTDNTGDRYTEGN